MADTEDAEFMDHKDIWQNPKEKEETNKESSSTEQNQLPLRKREFQQGHITGNPLTQRQRRSEPVD